MNLTIVPDLHIRQDIERVRKLLRKLNCYEDSSDIQHKWKSLNATLQSPLLCKVRQQYEYHFAQLAHLSDHEQRAQTCSAMTLRSLCKAHGLLTRKVRLQRGEDRSFGFNLTGGLEQSSPIYISRLVDGGSAQRNGDLRAGDELLAVNGVNVKGEAHEKAVQLLKAANDYVILHVQYRKEDPPTQRDTIISVSLRKH